MQFTAKEAKEWTTEAHERKEKNFLRKIKKVKKQIINRIQDAAFEGETVVWAYLNSSLYFSPQEVVKGKVIIAEWLKALGYTIEVYDPDSSDAIRISW